MKKKIFITLCTIFMAILPQTISADEIEQADLKNQDVRLFANIASTYTVKLPSEVDVTNLNTSFKIAFKGNISSNEQISVSMPEHVNLVDDKKFTTGHDLIDIAVSVDKNDFIYSDLEEKLYIEDAEATVSLAHATIPAGNWSVTLPITIGLTDRVK